MSTRAPKHCGIQGCTTLVRPGQRCPQHQHSWPTTKGRNVPYTLQQACFKRDRWTCQRCGYRGRPNAGQLHADHKRNRAAGGQDTLDNLETLCTVCHGPKSKAEAARARGGEGPPTP